MIQGEAFIECLREAEVRLYQSGLVSVVSELTQRVPGSEVDVTAAQMDIGSFSWPGVTLRLPEIWIGSERGRLTLVFESVQQSERIPELGLHGWLVRGYEIGYNRSSRITPFYTRQDFIVDFPSEPAQETLRNTTIPGLLSNFREVVAGMDILASFI